MTFRERVEWLLRMALLIFILAAAAFLSGITAIRFAIRGRQVTMPELAGKSVADARSLLQRDGLQLRIADRVYSPLPVNAVVRQSPPGGMRVKVGQDAHVVLSLGPHEVKIPALEGQNQRAAKIVLLQSGLQIGEISSLYLSGYSPDWVVQQYPPSGGDATSPRVNLLVSEGPRPPAYVMPHLVGMNQFEAQRRLADAGFRQVKVTLVSAQEWPRGAVVAQLPPSGTRITLDMEIELSAAQ